jgi:membrane-bound lytic murein transglycosylase B
MINQVESNHGQFGGARLRQDGTESQPITGVPLDRTDGVRDIPDADHGMLDGDSVHDRAVGPTQFLSSTWRQYTPAGALPPPTRATGRIPGCPAAQPGSSSPPILNYG